MVAGALAGCTTTPTPSGALPTGNLPTTSTPAATVPAAPEELRILTHDSYYIDQSVITDFEKTHNAKVTTIPIGDAGAALNAAILNVDHPIADLMFGVDNTLLSRALGAGVFTPYHPANASKIDPKYAFDPTWHVTPLDYGYVALNDDTAALAKANLTPPATLEDLAKPQWKGKLVVEDPAVSSTGNAFLLATVAHFGDPGYKEYWASLKANGVKVSEDWNDAYFTRFSAGGGDGAQPLVVSYTTSPPFEVREACTVNDTYIGLAKCAAEKKVMHTGTLDLPQGEWLQIEAIGLLNNSAHASLAKQFIEFALSKEY
ncbi:MAG: thiamine ABC transporter substrate-binding protein, partial [Thermoplasmatota archaeon]